MVLATGLPFETVAGFTEAQYDAIQRAMIRHWQMMAEVNGIRAIFGGTKKGGSGDATEDFEAKVKRMKKVTGRNEFDIWEVL